MDVPADLKELSATLATIESVVDVPTLRTELSALEADASRPDLWDDVENAQRVTSRMSYVQSEIRRVEDLRRRLDDTQTLWDLAEEMNDADSRAEAENELSGLQQSMKFELGPARRPGPYELAQSAKLNVAVLRVASLDPISEFGCVQQLP